jgi:hypothetical protein
MSATEADTSSARKRVRFDGGTVPSDTSTSTDAAKVLYDGLSSLHTTFQGGETVLQCNKHITLLKKLTKKVDYAKKFEDNAFVPHSLRIKTKLKSSLDVSLSEDFKQLELEFEMAKETFIEAATGIMQKTAEFEVSNARNELSKSTAKFIHDIMIINLVRHQASREPNNMVVVMSTICYLCSKPQLVNDLSQMELPKIFCDVEPATFTSQACNSLFNLAPVVLTSEEDFNRLHVKVRTVATKCAIDINSTVLACINKIEKERIQSLEDEEIAKLIAAEKCETAAKDTEMLIDNIDVNDRPASLEHYILDTVRKEIVKSSGNSKEGQTLNTKKGASLKKKNQKGKEKTLKAGANSKDSQKGKQKSSKHGNPKATNPRGGAGVKKNVRGRGRGRGGRR